MATQKFCVLKPICNSVDEAFSRGFVYRGMLKFGKLLWVFLCNLVFGLFGFFIKRSKLDDGHENNSDATLLFHEQEDENFRTSLSEGSKDFYSHGFCEERKSEFTFGFRFQVKEEDLINYKSVIEEKTGDSVFLEDGAETTMMSTSKYQVISVKDIGGFVQEPESVSFSVQEMFVEEDSMKEKFSSNYSRKSRNLGEKVVPQEVKLEEQVKVKELNEASYIPTNGKVDDDSMVTEKSSAEFLEMGKHYEIDAVCDQERAEDSVENYSGCDRKDELRDESQLDLGKTGVSKTEQGNWLGEFLLRSESFSYGNQFSQDNESFPADPQHESHDTGEGFFSICPQNVESSCNGKPQYAIPGVIQETNEEFNEANLSSELMDDYIEFEPHSEISEEKIQWNSGYSEAQESDSRLEDSVESEYEHRKSFHFEECEKEKMWEYYSDEEDEADVLMEHQELIDQMKMELRSARTGGLPTILEECETPRIKEDLKPLKIDEKLEHRDRMAEIQKFYKSYAEKMRKLDVLNYQTLQAINFLRMKHPEQLNTGENSSLSAIKSVLLPNFWPCKLRRIYADPTLKSITELQRDLELVYVGQTCLSWEILHWQYKKAKELQQYDPQGHRSYNQVAIEFQQFHVHLQRFTEDETFQGPRVQNYANQRCLIRGLLQVPAVKDDSLKEKKARKEDGDAVSIAMLANIIKESMRVFWEFLRSDKDTTNLILSIVLQGSKAQLQDPADYELLMDIKSSHQKKEKRLKDLLRTGNCLVKKFQKHQGETVLDEHMFVSQVELRLVSRVLSLPRLTRDQLLWCQTKLNNVHFIDRKIRVEETLFLLFPC